MVELYFNGTCEPFNPGGTASYGFLIKKNGEKIISESKIIGSGEEMTINVGIYNGLINGIEAFSKLNISNEKLIIYTDSDMIYNFVSKKWGWNKNKDKWTPHKNKPHLKKLLDKTLSLLNTKNYELIFIPVKNNKEAYFLSKKPLIEMGIIKEKHCRGGGWTLEKIKKGFDAFIEKNGKLPTALEIDKIENLPTSRQIQRRFGGLEKIRKELGYNETHMGKGQNRANISFNIGIRGRNEEIKLEKWLREKFGEVFVHTEKILNISNKNRVDFYVYCPEGNFGIDVFYPETIKTLMNNVNIKIKKYKDIKEKIYLVSANISITQNMIDKYSLGKKNELPKNIEIYNIINFKEKVEKNTINNKNHV